MEEFKDIFDMRDKILNAKNLSDNNKFLLLTELRSLYIKLNPNDYETLSKFIPVTLSTNYRIIKGLKERKAEGENVLL